MQLRPEIALSVFITDSFHGSSIGSCQLCYAGESRQAPQMVKISMKLIIFISGQVSSRCQSNGIMRCRKHCGLEKPWKKLVSCGSLKSTDLETESSCT